MLIILILGEGISTIKKETDTLLVASRNIGKRDEVTEEWRILHNEELNYLYSLPNIVRVVNQEE
jgi:hypothetical protein